MKKAWLLEFVERWYVSRKYTKAPQVAKPQRVWLGICLKPWNPKWYYRTRWNNNPLLWTCALYQLFLGWLLCMVTLCLKWLWSVKQFFTYTASLLSDGHCTCMYVWNVGNLVMASSSFRGNWEAKKEIMRVWHDKGLLFTAGKESVPLKGSWNSPAGSIRRCRWERITGFWHKQR